MPTHARADDADSSRPCGQGGFTLIEMVVTIAIFAVLSGTVIIGIGSLRGRASDEVCQADLQVVEGAVAVYRATYDNTPPANLQALRDASLIKTRPVLDSRLSVTDGVVMLIGDCAP